MADVEAHTADAADLGMVTEVAVVEALEEAEAASAVKRTRARHRGHVAPAATVVVVNGGNQQDWVRNHHVVPGSGPVYITSWDHHGVLIVPIMKLC